VSRTHVERREERDETARRGKRGGAKYRIQEEAKRGASEAGGVVIGRARGAKDWKRGAK